MGRSSVPPEILKPDRKDGHSWKVVWLGQCPVRVAQAAMQVMWLSVPRFYCPPPTLGKSWYSSVSELHTRWLWRWIWYNQETCWCSSVECLEWDSGGTNWFDIPQSAFCLQAASINKVQIDTSGKVLQVIMYFLAVRWRAKYGKVLKGFLLSYWRLMTMWRPTNHHVTAQGKLKSQACLG